MDALALAQQIVKAATESGLRQVRILLALDGDAVEVTFETRELLPKLDIPPRRPDVIG